MDSAAQDNLNHLLILALEGAITEEQVGQMNRLIGSGDETAAYCMAFLEIAADLYRSKTHLSMADTSGPETLGEAIERDERVRARQAAYLAEERREEIQKAAEMALERFKEQERRRQEELAHRRYLARRRQLTVGAFAAVALVLVTLSGWLASRPAEPIASPAVQPTASPTPAPPPLVATVSRASRVQWDRSDVDPTAGTGLTAGVITLQKGFLEIAFPRDARLIVEAPAEVNLVDERRVRLDRGMLTAHVPEEARGFEVETPSARVTDLGTEFAVAVDLGGAADVHVLDGWVAASFTAPGHDDQARVKALHRDSAMRFDARGGTMRSIAVDQERFARSWDEVLYKPNVGGDAKFERSVPPSLRERECESDDHIRIFLERNDVILPAGTALEITASGTSRSFEGRSQPLPAACTVDSYLIHWDPASPRGAERIVRGRLTFRRPIVGLIATGNGLAGSDRVFGHPGTMYPDLHRTPGRRLESETDARNGDMVTLSPDRLTLDVRLRANSMDQVRVLVTAAAVDER